MSILRAKAIERSEEADMLLSLKKALNVDEVAPKEKHVQSLSYLSQRGCLIVLTFGMSVQNASSTLATGTPLQQYGLG